MAKYDVWFTVADQYVVTLEADSIEEIHDFIGENPEGDFFGRSWVDGKINVDHYQEVKDEG